MQSVLCIDEALFPPPPQPATVRIMDAAMTAARAFKREFLDFILCLLKECHGWQQHIFQNGIFRSGIHRRR